MHVCFGCNFKSSFFNCRVLKQTIRSSGANITVQHIEDISLCGLFLMDAAKRADELFGVHKPSTRHTVRDAQGDINRMCSYLTDNNACKEDLSKLCINVLVAYQECRTVFPLGELDPVLQFFLKLLRPHL